MMSGYTTQEKIDMVLWHTAGNSSRRVTELFSVKYPNRPIPSSSTVLRTFTLFKETGCVFRLPASANKDPPPPVISEEITLMVLAAIENNSDLSLRDIAQELDVSHTSVHRILRQHGYKSVCQNLVNTDISVNEKTKWEGSSARQREKGSCNRKGENGSRKIQRKSSAQQEPRPKRQRKLQKINKRKKSERVGSVPDEDDKVCFSVERQEMQEYKVKKEEADEFDDVPAFESMFVKEETVLQRDNFENEDE